MAPEVEVALLLLLSALAQEVPPPHRRPQDGAVAVVCREGAEEGGDGTVVGQLLVWNVVEPGAGRLLKGIAAVLSIPLMKEIISVRLPLDCMMRLGAVFFLQSWPPFR